MDNLPSWASYDAGDVHERWLDMLKSEKEVDNEGIGDYGTHTEEYYKVKFKAGFVVGEKKLSSDVWSESELYKNDTTESEKRLLIGRGYDTDGTIIAKILNWDTSVSIKQGSKTITFSALTAAERSAATAMHLPEIIAAQFEEGTGQVLGQTLNGDAASEVNPYVLRSATTFKNSYSNVGVKMNEGWYTEVCTVLALKKFVTTFDITMSTIYTDKIPISWAPPSPTNKNNLFTEGVKCYAVTDLQIPGINKTFALRRVGRPDFIISDANIHDMKFGS